MPEGVAVGEAGGKAGRRVESAEREIGRVGIVEVFFESVQRAFNDTWLVGFEAFALLRLLPRQLLRTGLSAGRGHTPRHRGHYDDGQDVTEWLFDPHVAARIIP